MRRAAVLPLLASAAAASAIAGCGQTDNAKDYRGADKQVAAAIDDISSHARKLEASKICDDFMTAELKAKLSARARRDRRGSDCADQLKDSLRDADAFDMDVQSIDISGATATVEVKIKTNADADPVGTLKLVRVAAEGGSQRGWRISTLP